MQTNISPVAVFPGTANVLDIRSICLSPTPGYYYELQEILFDPEFNPSLRTLKNGNVSMTQEQWNNWPAGLGPDGDSDYQLDCIAENLGLTRETKKVE
jgi:hypothetical protein